MPQFAWPSVSIQKWCCRMKEIHLGTNVKNYSQEFESNSPISYPPDTRKKKPQYQFKAMGLLKLSYKFPKIRHYELDHIFAVNICARHNFAGNIPNQAFCKGGELIGYSLYIQ